MSSKTPVRTRYPPFLPGTLSWRSLLVITGIRSGHRHHSSTMYDVTVVSWLKLWGMIALSDECFSIQAGYVFQLRRAARNCGLEGFISKLCRKKWTTNEFWQWSYTVYNDPIVSDVELSSWGYVKSFSVYDRPSKYHLEQIPVPINLPLVSMVRYNILENALKCTISMWK